MNKLSRLIFATTLLVAAPLTFACDYPQPPEIPEGATASKEEMVAASKAVKAYQGDMVSYREECLSERGSVELTCEFCNRAFNYSPEEVGAILRGEIPETSLH